VPTTTTLGKALPSFSQTALVNHKVKEKQKEKSRPGRGDPGARGLADHLDLY
jgi:hypothetical protein